MSAPEFDPPARSGFDADGAKHRRNLRALGDFLRSKHIGSGQLSAGAVDSSALGAGAVTDAAVSDVSADKVTAGTLRSDVVVSGSISPAESGQRVLMDAAGLHFVDGSGNILGTFPTGEGNAFLKAAFEALGLIVTGKMTLRDDGTSEGHLIEPGTKITLGGATTGATIADPSVRPGLQQVWETLTLGSGTSAIAGRTGLWHDATNTSYWTAKGSTLYEYNDDGTFIRSKTITDAAEIRGVVRIGTRVYVLFWDSTAWVIRTYNESNLSYLGSCDVVARSGHSIIGGPALGDDGTNIIVVDFDSLAAGKLRFTKFTRADSPAFVSTTTSSGAGNPTYSVGKAWGLVAAEGLLWVAVEGYSFLSPGTVRAFSTAFVYDQDREFPSFGGQPPRGVAHDGTRFWTLMSDTRICKHTDWKWTSESARYWVAYTWVDDNGAASAGARPLGAGDFESRKSPTNQITLHRRGRLRVTVPTFPSGMTHAGLYMDRGAAEPTLDYVADTSDVTEEFVSFTAGGAAPPGSNTHPSGTNAVLQSSNATPVLRANGLPRARFRQGNDQSIADATEATLDWASGTTVIDTDSIFDVANDRLQWPFAASVMIQASCRFEGDADGYRRLLAQTSSDGAAWTDLTDDGFLSRIGNAGGGGPTTCFIGGQIEVTAGHFLRLRAEHAAGAALNVTDWNLSILFVGPS